MAALRLRGRQLEKVWGRARLPAPFARADDPEAKIGEIVFDHPGAAGAPLLVKFLFTSERLSVQVHPDDAAAARAGLRSGKDEAWIVTAADPGAEIATGVRRPVSPEELEKGARDGSILGLLDWQQVRAGDSLYSPAGTIHAIGAGVSAIEVQQNSDVTYRLYDYGRDRELHLSDALAVARREPADLRQAPVALAPRRTRLVAGSKLAIERLDGAGAGTIPAATGGPAWLIPLGPGRLGEHLLSEGEVWLLDAPQEVALPAGSALLVATQQMLDGEFWRVHG